MKIRAKSSKDGNLVEIIAVKGPVTVVSTVCRRGFTRQARKPKRAHLRVPALQNTTKSPREDPQEREERRKIVAGKGKQARNFGAPFGAPTPFKTPHAFGDRSSPRPTRPGQTPTPKPPPKTKSGQTWNWPKLVSQLFRTFVLPL